MSWNGNTGMVRITPERIERIREKSRRANARLAAFGRRKPSDEAVFWASMWTVLLFQINTQL